MKTGTLVLAGLGALMVIYGCIICSVRSGSHFFLVWFALGVLFAGLAVMNQMDLWDAVPKYVKLVLTVLCFLCVIGLISTQALVLSKVNAEGEPDLDYIIVLGSQVKKDGPALITKYRLDKAYEYLEYFPETLCIVSGGKGANEPAPEAEIMKQYLIDKGIDPDRIITEEKSRNTAEYIAFSGQLIDKQDDRVGIVTNDFHVYRAERLAMHNGYWYVSGIAAKSRRLYFPNNALRESFGIIKDLLAGNI